MTTATLILLLPEIVLIAAAVAIYMGGAFSATQRAWPWIAGGALLLRRRCAGVPAWFRRGRRTVATRRTGVVGAAGWPSGWAPCFS